MLYGAEIAANPDMFVKMVVTMQRDSSTRSPSLARKLLSLFTGVVLLLAMVWALLNRQLIVDSFIAWRFEPSSQVVTLADQSGMSDRGRFLFMASQPQIDDRSDFNNNCTSREHSSVVLGCYVSNGLVGRIFIFNVTDERISDVKIVTAAHEMLHAAYGRLSDSEKSKLNKLLEEQFANTTDQAILDSMKAYDTIEPGERLNELHSIFGTEVTVVSKALEQHYKQFFADRSKVLAAYTTYYKVFSKLQSQIDSLQTQLAGKKTLIDAKTTEYDKKTTQLEADIKAFNEKAAAVNGFTSKVEFTSARALLLAKQATLKDLASSINQLVDEYNQGVVDLNALGVEINKLNQNLNSHASTLAE